MRAQTPTAQEIASSEAAMRLATVAVDHAAARIFRDAGERYTSPRIVGYEGSILTPCGNMQAGNAYACRMDGNIYYDRAFIASLRTRAARADQSDGNMAVIFPIAHEWGHALQFMLGLDYSQYDTSEPDADCLAGVLISASRNGAPLRAAELADAKYTMQFIGDPPMVTGEWARVMEQMNANGRRRGGFSNAIGNHGNAQERMTSFRKGLGSSFRSCVADIPRFGRTVAQSGTTSQPPAPASLVIHWFVDNTADAYDLGVAQHKPIVLVTGDFNGTYFKRLRNEVLSSPQLAQLAPYAIFVYADPSHDIVAKNFGKALGYDKWPVISLLGPNGEALDEEVRLVGLWDAQTVVTQLSTHMRSKGWLPSPSSTSRPPWMPPLP
jgi:predicted metalloprotease